MNIAFLSPYLLTFGGGEKYLLDIARALHEQDHHTTLLWPRETVKNELLKRFGNEYQFINIDTHWHTMNAVQKVIKSASYDAIFYHPDGSYFFSLAKKNFALLQVPDATLVHSKNLLNQIKLSRFTPVFNSLFTKRFFLKHIHAPHATALYPTVSAEFFQDAQPHQKENIILSVGRFFRHLHSKKQEVLIKAFVKAQKNYAEFHNYQLILAGACQPEDEKYLSYLKKLAENNPAVLFEVNISHERLGTFYRKARFYWHAAGYGEDEYKHPERAEHFGIALIEAMASSAIPLAYRAGGPIEIILHQKTGFLYQTPQELVRYTSLLIKNVKKTALMQELARKRAEKKFGPTVFAQHVAKLLL